MHLDEQHSSLQASLIGGLQYTHTDIHIHNSAVVHVNVPLLLLAYHSMNRHMHTHKQYHAISVQFHVHYVLTRAGKLFGKDSHVHS